MNNSLAYQGYAARIEYSSEDQCFIGHLAGVKDVIGFHDESVTELKSAFEDAVEDYLATCAKTGKEAQKAYSGKLMLRHTSRCSCSHSNSGRIEWAKHKSMGVQRLKQRSIAVVDA